MLELPEALVLAGQINERARGRRVVRAEAGGTPHRFAFFTGDSADYPLLLTGRTIDAAYPLARLVELALGDPARVLREGEPNLGSDDFGYFVERVPGVYMSLGCRPPEGDCGGLHTPQFRPDEACIPVGVQAMAGAVLELCGM